MKIVVLIARVLVGLGFVVFGLNILVPFLPQPELPADSLAAQFMTVMVPTHWMKLVGLTQLVGGALVASGRLAPLGLAMLAPVLVNILAFHVFITNGEGLGPGLVFSALVGVLVYAYRAHFAGIFDANAKPNI